MSRMRISASMPRPACAAINSHDRIAIHNSIAEDSTAAKTLAVTVTNLVNSANYSTRLLVAQLELI